MDDLNIKALRALSHCPMSADQLAEVLKISPGQSRELLHKLNPLLTVEASDAGAAFRLNAGMATVGVVDFSEARVLLLLSDLGGRVLARTSLPRAFIITESVLFETLNRLEALLNEQAVAELSALVLAVPGEIAPDSGRLIRSSRFADPENLDLEALFSERFRCPVLLKNDIRLAVEGELRYGNIQSAENALMICFNASLGSAIMLGGQVYTGTHGLAGQLEHLLVNITDDNEPGSLAYCLSVPGMVKRANKELEKYPDSLLHKLKDEDGVHTQDLCRGYLQNDPLCERIVHRAGKILANLIFNLGMFLDINTVVLNGDITGFGDKFLDYMRSVMPGSVLPIRVSYSGLKGRAAAVGGIQTAAEAAQAQLLNQAGR